MLEYANQLNVTFLEAQVSEAIDKSTNVCCPNGWGRRSRLQKRNYFLVAKTTQRLDIQRAKKGHKPPIS